jgi:hypothetical protein
LTERVADLALEAAETGRQAGLVRANSAAVSGAIAELDRSVVTLIRESATDADRTPSRQAA